MDTWIFDARVHDLTGGVRPGSQQMEHASVCIGVTGRRVAFESQSKSS